ncbi:MAG TPA: glycine oxidase ThiO [Candidatus Angelobacter sp.]|nr:glycine oxidase ThiO [Candidatus Angelobacter sp.]
MDSVDVIIAGAGIIGLSLALELRERGMTVLVLDRAQPGQEASSAAAGMLAAGGFETPAALRPLALESARLFPEYVRRLGELSGIQPDFRRHGTIVFGEHAAPPESTQLSAEELRNREPFLQSLGQSVFFVQEDSVDPRLLTKAALAAAQKAGVEIRGDTEVKNFRAAGNVLEAVTNSGTLTAAQAVNCMGAWSGAPVRPRKGQMLYLQPARHSLLKHVVHAPEVYIVPRSSGKILLGATLEDTGFDKTVVPSAIEVLRSAAIRYLPELASAPVVESWAGLRPGTPDDLPILGPAETPGLFIAGGHFRNGILLAPVTAKIMADVLTAKTPALDVSAFAPSRFAAAKA